MTRRIVFAVLSVALIGAFSGCAPGTEAPEPVDGQPGAELRLAPGLYDQEDGTVLAIGTLEWVDLEGGFWAIIDGSQSDTAGGNVAVIADPTGFESELDALQGRSVSVIGTRFDGASIRMAGPEIEITSIEEIAGTSDPAE